MFMLATNEQIIESYADHGLMAKIDSKGIVSFKFSDQTGRRRNGWTIAGHIIDFRVDANGKVTTPSERAVTEGMIVDLIMGNA